MTLAQWFTHRENGGFFQSRNRRSARAISLNPACLGEWQWLVSDNGRSGGRCGACGYGLEGRGYPVITFELVACDIFGLSAGIDVSATAGPMFGREAGKIL